MAFEKGNVPWNKGKRHTADARQKMSVARKGRAPWNKGRTLSEEHRRRLSEGHKGIPSYWRGKHRSEEAKRKMSEAQKGERHHFFGKHHSEKTRRKLSKAMMGKHRSGETKRRMSEAKRGKKNPGWKGGYEPYYGPDWKHQRRLARERDHGICWMCKTKEDDKKHATHHIVPFRVYGIDRYEQANKLENLMTLCQPCHQRIETITVEEDNPCPSH